MDDYVRNRLWQIYNYRAQELEGGSMVGGAMVGGSMYRSKSRPMYKRGGSQMRHKVDKALNTALAKHKSKK